MMLGLLLAAIAVMMIEQSARWLLTAATRGQFVRDEFQITYFRDEPGRSGFGYGGDVVSSGETWASRGATIVSSDRLRELKAAGEIPGGRVPVYYLAPRAPWTMVDNLVAFRVQAPDVFEVNAAGWVVVNAVFAAGAVWLIRRSVSIVRSATG